jgi:hypothetical protein
MMRKLSRWRHEVLPAPAEASSLLSVCMYCMNESCLESMRIVSVAVS